VSNTKEENTLTLNDPCASPYRRPRLGRVAAASLLTVLGLPAAHALELGTGNPELKVNWDTTFKYSTAFRVKDRSPAIVGGDNYDPAGGHYFPNTDDGSNNFSRGLISNRLDVFSELDVVFRDFGARASAAGWYDAVYHRRNDNDSPN